jgi:hypothetical protein
LKLGQQIKSKMKKKKNSASSCLGNLPKNLMGALTGGHLLVQNDVWLNQLNVTNILEISLK